MRPTSPTPSRTCGRRGRPCRRRSSPTPRRSPGSTSASPATSCGIARPPPPVAAGRSTSAASEEQPHDRCSRPVQVSRCLSDNRRYGLSYRARVVAQHPELAAIDISKLRLGTLHGLCNDLLQEHRAPNYQNVRLMDELETSMFVYEQLSIVDAPDEATDRPFW